MASGDRSRGRWAPGLLLIGSAWLAALPVAAAPPRVLFLEVAKQALAPGGATSPGGRRDPGADMAPLLVALRLAEAEGPGSRAVAWPEGGATWLFARHDGGQSNRHDVVPEDPAGAVSFFAAPQGVTLLGADFPGRLLAVTAGELRSFAASVGAASVAESLAAGDQGAPLTVRHVLSTKALVRAGDAASASARRSSAVATSKSGQAVEIRVHFDPTLPRAGSDLPLTAYVDGDKRPGMFVRATSAATEKTQSFVTDAGGSGHFRLEEAGAWRVEAHDIRPPERKGEPWSVATATLTFVVGPSSP